MEELLQKHSQCTEEIDELTSRIESSEKELQIEIQETIAKRRAELEKSYDKEIAKEKDRIKSIQSKRTKAKNKGMKERIAIATRPYVETNKSLHKEIKGAFKNKGIPGYCDSSWYYALFMPKGLRDWFTLIVVAAIFVIFLPSIVLLLLGLPWWANMLLGLLWELILAGIYITIFLLTKDKDHFVLEDMREKRDEILNNQREIRKIKKAIKGEKDDSIYQLESFDEKIQDAENSISEIENKKSGALKIFDETTKGEIEAQLKERKQGKIDELKNKLDAMIAERTSLAQEIEQRERAIADGTEESGEATNGAIADDTEESGEFANAEAFVKEEDSSEKEE